MKLKTYLLIFAIILLLSQVAFYLMWSQRGRLHHRDGIMSHEYQNAQEIEIDLSPYALDSRAIIDKSNMYKINKNVLKILDLDEDLVTLVTQTSVSQLFHLVDLCGRWEGPISVSIFTPDVDLKLLEGIIGKIQSCCSEMNEKLLIHLVYPIDNPVVYNVRSVYVDIATEIGHSCQYLRTYLINLFPDKNYGTEGIPYPVNLLRNVARKGIQTDMMFLIDIDMSPSAYLHTQFVNASLSGSLGGDEKTVYVLPVFEINSKTPVPTHKTNLLHLINMEIARPFYFEMCWHCQNPTNYEKWEKIAPGQTIGIAYEVKWSSYWEPFYISKNFVPFYDERFKQYGFNRISQLCEMYIAGYNFKILDNAFLVHKGLKTRPDFHRSKDEENNVNRELYKQFKNEVLYKYPNSDRSC